MAPSPRTVPARASYTKVHNENAGNILPVAAKVQGSKGAHGLNVRSEQ